MVSLIDSVNGLWEEEEEEEEEQKRRKKRKEEGGQCRFDSVLGEIGEVVSGSLDSLSAVAAFLEVMISNPPFFMPCPYL